MAVAAAPVIIPAQIHQSLVKKPLLQHLITTGSLFVNTNRIIDARSKTIRLLRSGTSSLIKKNIDL
jgi:hypothetical protein